MMVFALMTVLSVNAQTAIETPKFTDNIYAGAGAGVMTPLDFNSMFPINTTLTVRAGKEIIPQLAFEIEGLTTLNDNHWTDVKTAFKAFNIGGNAVFNLSNIFDGYTGAPRHFELKANTGLGWLHYCGNDKGASNYLTAKTALDFVINIGKTRALSVIVSPGIYWSLNGFNGTIDNIKFNKHAAQAAILGTLVWHFKTSNGTRHFKTYDVGAMIGEIDRLNTELAKKPAVEVQRIVEAAPTQTIYVKDTHPVVVFFAQGSAELTENAIKTLDGIDETAPVSVFGYASPEGTEDFNKQLSQNRADAVANYLKNRGVDVVVTEGRGVEFGPATNRIVIITSEKD